MRTKRPGPPKKIRPQRDAQGRFAVSRRPQAKPSNESVLGRVDPATLAKQLAAMQDRSLTLDSLTAEFDREFPEMKSNRSEVGIVVTLVLLAAVAACYFIAHA